MIVYPYPHFVVKAISKEKAYEYAIKHVIYVYIRACGHAYIEANEI
jgi:hypothetical protein